MSVSIAATPPLVEGASERMARLADRRAPARLRPGHLQRAMAYLGDAALLLVVVFLIPVVILLVGSPLALFVRFLVEIVRHW